MNISMSTVCAVVLLSGALAGCGGVPEGVDDLADELGDSLEPSRDYVEEPADEPPAPR